MSKDVNTKEQGSGIAFSINSCGASDCQPGWHWTTAASGFDDYDLWAVFRGHGQLSCGEMSFDISAGDCFILPPHRKVVATHDPDDPIYAVHVHFSAVGDPRFDGITEAEYRYITDTVFFRDLLNRVVTYHYKNENDTAVFWLSAALFEFFHSDIKATPRVSAGTNEQNVYAICETINMSSGNIPRLAEFAAQYNYSETYLGRLFYKVIGVKFTEYLINARINKAKFLLRSSKDSVTSIAEALGYCDTCAFVKQFSKVVGITPGQYRNS